MGDNKNHNTFFAFLDAVYDLVDKPVTFFREKIVVPNQQKYPWYHEKFRRVPTIDQCDDDDMVCDFEADVQFKRDKLVDNEILQILRQRLEDCLNYEQPDSFNRCKHLYETVRENETNWFIKYGDLGAYATSRRAYMKQKHRMLWERRHGPVGTGMKEDF